MTPKKTEPKFFIRYVNRNNNYIFQWNVYRLNKPVTIYIYRMNILELILSKSMTELQFLNFVIKNRWPKTQKDEIK